MKILDEYYDNFLIGQNLTREKSPLANVYYEEDGYTFTDNIGFNKHVKGPEILYRINKDGFRSDSFNLFDKTKHNVLFGGCSITFAEGIPDEFAWTDIFSKKYNNDHSYNVSTGGGSIRLIIKNILTFIRNVGVPNDIFVIFPNFARDLRYDDVTEKIVSCVVNPGWISAPKEFRTQKEYTVNYKEEYGAYSAIEYIRIFEQVCKILGINLLWSCWNEKSNDIFRELDFSFYFEGDHLFNFDGNGSKFLPKDNTRNLPYWTVAQDGIHPGSGWHGHAAEEFLKEVKKRGIGEKI